MRAGSRRANEEDDGVVVALVVEYCRNDDFSLCDKSNDTHESWGPGPRRLIARPRDRAREMAPLSVEVDRGVLVRWAF